VRLVASGHETAMAPVLLLFAERERVRESERSSSSSSTSSLNSFGYVAALAALH